MRFITALNISVFLFTINIQAQELTKREISDVLYSSKLSFTDKNIPIVTIFIMGGKDKIYFSSSKNLTFLPEGENGSEISLLKTNNFIARLNNGKKAEFQYFIVIGKFKSNELQKLKEEKWVWEGRGFKTKVITIGSIFGFFGKVLDNRVNILLIDEPFKNESDTNSLIEKIKQKYETTLTTRKEISKKPKGTIEITDEQGEKILIRTPDVIWVKPEQGSDINIKDVEFAKGYSWEGHEDRKFRGQIYFTIDAEGKLAVVNVVDSEELLKGIVPSEIYVNSPMEALKAQAVTARGELFAKLGLMHIGDPYQSCSEQHCQVYSGISKENPLVSKAVDATRGEMLFYGIELVDSVYSSCCGGHTESSSKVWGTEDKPYLQGIFDMEKGKKWKDGINENNIEDWINKPSSDAFCAVSSFSKKNYRWNKTVKWKDLEKNIKSIKNIGKVLDLKVLERGISGRILKILIKGSEGELIIEPELKIRKVLGGLKSSMFIFSFTKSKTGEIEAINFAGGGFGHGVGMCQMGAIGMAEKGFNYKEILKHYYSGAEVVKIY